MSRQNPRRPSLPAGDNPAGRTRGFNFKLTPQVTSRVAASSTDPSEQMASLSSSLAGPSHPQVGAGAPSAAAVQPLPAASSADLDDRLFGRVSDAPVSSGLHAFSALPQTPIKTRAPREAPGGGYQLSEPDGYSPAQQVRAYSPGPRAHHSSDTTHDQSHRSPDRILAPESEFTQGPDFGRAARPAVSETPGPSGRGPSHAESSERAQARLDAIRAEELRIDAILRAKQPDFQFIETRRAAEKDRFHRELQQHQRDLQACQAEADRLDHQHRARLLQFQRERELHEQLDRERADDERASSPSRFQRNYPPRLYRIRQRVPRWERPQQALRQPQRPCLTNRPQKPAVTLDCVFVSSFVRPLALLLPLTQFPQFLLSACSLCGPSILAPRMKSLGGTSPRRRPLLRASIDAKTRHSSRTCVATHTSSHSNRLVAIWQSAFNDRLCPPYRFISRQAPWPIGSRPRALENCSTMRSSNSARNSSAPQHSKLLLLRLSIKQLLHGVSWSRRPAMARSTASTPYLSVLLFLRMILACLCWPLLAATRTLTRARSSAFTLSVLPEPSSALERHVS